MKNLIFLALLCLLTISPSFAHPGKTDRHGGHKCLKACEEWKLYYTEYHLHDKDGRPIRVDKRSRKRASTPVVASRVTPTEVTQVVTAPTNTVTVTVYRTVDRENNLLLVNPLLYLLLLLLLLLLIFRMNRYKQE
jgi:hypothetical protein